MRADHPRGWRLARSLTFTAIGWLVQVNLHETHRPYEEATRNPTDPAKVTLPPYLPDHPISREDWALYHDSIATLDERVGKVLELFEEEGLDRNTIVFFFGDNGRECFRGKNFPYEHGFRVPLLVRWPGVLPAGSSSEDPVAPREILEDHRRKMERLFGRAP
jgi:arylsulfatase A-like enzyme